MHVYRLDIADFDPVGSHVAVVHASKPKRFIYQCLVIIERKRWAGPSDHNVIAKTTKEREREREKSLTQPFPLEKEERKIKVMSER